MSAPKKPQDSTFNKFRAKAIERERANKERQEIEKRQRLQEQENKRLEREKQREMEEERALNLNKSGSWAPESMPGAAHRSAPSSTPSPNAGHHAVPQGGDTPHPPAVSDRDALRKLEAEKRRKQANQNPIDMNQQSQIMSMFEDML